MHAVITTTVNQATGRYRVVVVVDGHLAAAHGATPGTVTRLRNRLNAEWSNRADSVYAGPIPPIATLINSPGE